MAKTSQQPAKGRRRPITMPDSIAIGLAVPRRIESKPAQPPAAKTDQSQ